eukprot:468294-Pleurochrysis_carterae.AAC.1
MLGSYWGRALKPSVVDLSEPCLILGYCEATGGGSGTRSHILRSAQRVQYHVDVAALVCEGKDAAATLRARASRFYEGMNQMVTTPVLRVHAADNQPGKNVDIDVRFS